MNLVEETEEYGSWNTTMKAWTPAMGILVKGEIDLVVVDMIMTSHRTGSIDFTMPILLPRSFFYVR